MNNEIRLVIADDHLLFIEGLRLLLQTEEDIFIVDVAHDGKELLHLVGSVKPDLVLLDINMPQMNGIDACRYIQQSHPNVKIIILSTYNEQHLVEKAIQTGAQSYLLKDCTKETLVETIRKVSQGHYSFLEKTPSQTNNGTNADLFSKRFQLSRRELDILRLMKEDHTNQEIAERLFLSVYTVETHRKNIRRKLGLTSHRSMVKFLLENEF